MCCVTCYFQLKMRSDSSTAVVTQQKNLAQAAHMVAFAVPT